MLSSKLLLLRESLLHQGIVVGLPAVAGQLERAKRGPLPLQGSSHQLQGDLSVPVSRKEEVIQGKS